MGQHIRMFATHERISCGFAPSKSAFAPSTQPKLCAATPVRMLELLSSQRARQSLRCDHQAQRSQIVGNQGVYSHTLFVTNAPSHRETIVV